MCEGRREAVPDTARHGGQIWSFWRIASVANSSCVCERSMCAQSSMEVIGGKSVGASGVVSRVGSGTLVEVGSPPPDMEGRWSVGELVVVPPRSLCMLAGGQ